MARPIQDTPVLKGKNAKRFAEKMEESRRNPVSKEERARVMANYEKVKAMIKFE